MSLDIDEFVYIGYYWINAKVGAYRHLLNTVMIVWVIYTSKNTFLFCSQTLHLLTYFRTVVSNNLFQKHNTYNDT